MGGDGGTVQEGSPEQSPTLGGRPVSPQLQSRLQRPPRALCHRPRALPGPGCMRMSSWGSCQGVSPSWACEGTGGHLAACPSRWSILVLVGWVQTGPGLWCCTQTASLVHVRSSGRAVYRGWRCHPAAGTGLGARALRGVTAGEPGPGDTRGVGHPRICLPWRCRWGDTREDPLAPSCPAVQGEGQPARVRGLVWGGRPAPAQEPALPALPTRECQPGRVLWVPVGCCGSLCVPRGCRGSLGVPAGSGLSPWQVTPSRAGLEGAVSGDGTSLFPLVLGTPG